MNGIVLEDASGVRQSVSEYYGQVGGRMDSRSKRACR
jgi:hypothetical protein